jgi:hypothetical protein
MKLIYNVKFEEDFCSCTKTFKPDKLSDKFAIVGQLNWEDLYIYRYCEDCYKTIFYEYKSPLYSIEQIKKIVAVS